MTGSPSLGNRANRSCTSYLTICELRSFKRSQNIFLYYKYQNIQDCSKIVTSESWHLTYQAWRLLLAGIFSTRECLLWFYTVMIDSRLTVRCSFYPNLVPRAFPLKAGKGKREKGKALGTRLLLSFLACCLLHIYSTYDIWDCIGPFDSLKFEKIWDCRSFRDFKTLTGFRSFRHRNQTV